MRSGFSARLDQFVHQGLTGGVFGGSDLLRGVGCDAITRHKRFGSYAVLGKSI